MCSVENFDEWMESGMGLFDKIKEPVILKQESSASVQLEQLRQMYSEVTNVKVKAMLEHDINLVNAGIFGESTILLELQNSHLPLFVLHDLHLEHQGLPSQIDFLVITKGRNFIIECKNLYGNITIDSSGSFIRTAWNRKEGIYSPITQSLRHLELIKQIRSDQKGSFLTKALFERNFYENYRSVVVLANPKTVLNAQTAPKGIREQVIRADQLIQYIKKVNSESGAVTSSEDDTVELANFFLHQHKPSETDYLEKYRKMLSSAASSDKASITPSEEPSSDSVKKEVPASAFSEKIQETPVCPKCGAPMVKRKATKGEKAGTEFWGCSRFPHCHGIINISGQ